MSCSSKHPCFYCESSRVEGVWETDVQQRTVGNILLHMQEWQTQTGGDKGKAKQFMNCVEEPLIYPDDADAKLLLVCPPPALHLKLALNHILSSLADHWPDLLEWLSSLHVTLEPYHGGQNLEGNLALYI